MGKCCGGTVCNCRLKDECFCECSNCDYCYVKGPRLKPGTGGQRRPQANSSSCLVLVVLVIVVIIVVIAATTRTGWPHAGGRRYRPDYGRTRWRHQRPVRSRLD
jgi:hypothetical protein